MHLGETLALIEIFQSVFREVAKIIQFAVKLFFRRL